MELAPFFLPEGLDPIDERPVVLDPPFGPSSLLLFLSLDLRHLTFPALANDPCTFPLFRGRLTSMEAKSGNAEKDSSESMVRPMLCKPSPMLCKSSPILCKPRPMLCKLKSKGTFYRRNEIPDIFLSTHTITPINGYIFTSWSWGPSSCRRFGPR